jgi:ATP-dependent Zn protease
LLREHRAALEALAQQLLKQETVDGSAVKVALAATAALADPVNPAGSF